MDFFSIPDSCPVCGFPTSDEDSLLYCRNKKCAAKSTGLISTWVNNLGLLNWGDSLILSLTSGDNPVIKYPYELYDLSVEEIAKHCSGLKFAQKCHEILHAQKSVKLELILCSLSIPNLGIATAADIVNAGFDNLDKLSGITEQDLTGVPNIGTKTAKMISDALSEKFFIMQELSRRLTIIDGSHGILAGKSFCITGSTSKPRKALEKMIMDNGGRVRGAVTADLTFLVSNEDSNSAKAVKARKYCVKMITENDLLSLVRQ